MTGPKIPEGSDEFADRVDDALQALRRGSSDGLDRLIGDAGDSAPRLGALFYEALGLHRGTGAGLADPGEIENYRMIREIGRGGMGVIYEVEQIEPPRRVAVKVIKGPRQLDNQALRLFQREIHALALLRHPHIAAIHEAGRTEDGHHFFAMEYVDGGGLLDYVNGRGEGAPAKSLDIKAKLNLFVRICRAIHYAHQRGVIHRDLKPSNIIIDSAGEPKVLDFGLARITESDVSLTATITEAGKVMGTLAYMSPEQASGNTDDIDTRSDVYSLGVVLYEMLLDRLPYQLKGCTLPSAVRTICSDQPERPSTINRAVRGDIETILLKTLEKDPDQRYHSAAALADDIERHLEGAPILARPPTVTYQFRKLVARHRLPAALLALLVLSITAFAGVAAVQALHLTTERNAALAAQAREAKARAEAEIEAKKAFRITEFLRDMLAAASPYEEGRDVTVREVLDKAAEQIDEELYDFPEVQAAIHNAIGLTYLRLGVQDGAKRHLQTYLDMTRAQADRQPERLALALNDLALTLKQEDDFDGAEELYREALTGALLASGERSEAVATIRNNLGLLLKTTGRYAEAKDQMTQALELRKEFFGEAAPEVAVVLNTLAQVLRAQGDYPGAEKMQRQALAIRREALRVGHPYIAESLNNLATVLERLGKLEEAARLHREALQIYQLTHGETHPNVAYSMDNLASVLRQMGDEEAAERLWRDALEILREPQGDSNLSVATTLNNLASLLSFRGDVAESEALQREALAIRREKLGDKHPHVAQSLNNLGIDLYRQGRLAAAEVLVRDAVNLNQELLGDSHPRLANYRANLAAILRDQGKFAEARPLIEQAVRIQRESLPAGHPALGASLTTLGVVQLRTGDPAVAQTALEEALQLERKSLPVGHVGIASMQAVLGECYASLGEYDKAEPLLIESYPILKAEQGETDRGTVKLLGIIIDLYEAWGKSDEAQKYRAMLPKSDESASGDAAGDESDAKAPQAQ